MKRLVLDADAEGVLERARDEARRRRHAETEPIHLLFAAFRSVVAWNELRRRAIDVSELKSRVEPALTQRDEVGGYRDTTCVPPLSRASEALLARVRPRARLPLFARATAAELVEQLASEPTVASLLLELRSWDDSVAAVVTRASALASSRGHARVGVEHVLATVSGDAYFVRALQRLEVERERVRALLDEALASEPPGEGPPAPRGALRRALGSTEWAARRDAGGRPMRELLVIRLLEEPECALLFARGGVDSAELLHVIAHGGPPLDIAFSVPDEAMVEVVLHNDDVTTEELVVDILERDFGLATSAATRIMRAVHSAGIGVAGTYPAREARARRHDAIMRARGYGSPLRITLRRPAIPAT